MAKASSWGDDRTDPGIPAPGESTAVGPAPGLVDDDEIVEEEVFEEGAPVGGGKVHLRPDTGPVVSPDKTRVASMDAIAPSPANAEATMVTQSPILNGGGGNAEATVVTQNPLAAGRSPRATSRGRLVVVAGKEEGRVIDLTDGTRVFGRSKDCDVVLLDIQVSRRHTEMVADHNGVLVRDLGSGNGTLVNGDLIEEVRLVHGDEVALGDHVLRFEEDGPVASALVKRAPGAMAGHGPAATAASVDVVRRARRRRTQGDEGGGKKKKVVLLGGLTVVAAVVVVALVLKPEPEPPPPEGPTPQEVAQQSYVAGMQQFRDGAYDEALQRFEAAVAAFPNHPSAPRYLTATRREITARDAMARGAALLEQGDYAGAREAFGQVDSESLRHQEAQQSLRRVNESEARAAVIQGDELLEDDEIDDARSAYRRALSIVPDYPSAVRGLEKADEQEAALQRMSAAQRRQRAQAAAARARSERQRAQAAVRRALATGERFFDEGEFQRAVDAFNELAQSDDAALARPARQKAEAVRAFRPAYERGMTAAENRDAEQAVNDLTVAERHARAVNAGGTLHQQVRTRLADMHFLQGRVAFNGRRYAVAFNHYNEALKANPQHRYAQTGMDELRKLGEELYLEAYMVRTLNRETAIRQFRQVIAMTPPDFEYHQRSRERLAELER
jgi:tetratricopeptide (TPR) repeat protein